MSQLVHHFINGKTSESKSGRTAPVFNPAEGVVTKQVALADTAEVQNAIAAAATAFPAWAETSLIRRQAIMFNFRELLNARKADLAEILTSEHGKVVSDALGEITRGLEVVEFACGMPQVLKGDYSDGVSTGIDVFSTKDPLGVVGIISPFNFPAMVPMWFFPIALMAGNTVVLKPSEKDPSVANWLAELLKEAGLPDGVFNVVHGDKVAVDELLVNPAVQSISFVGSTPIAKYVYETGTAHGKRVQALGGAKNHMLVLPDADLDLVADSAVNAGFGSAGERCMAISVLMVIDSIADDLIARIAERMSTLKTGDGRRACDMGPLITREHRDKVASYVDVAIADGATVVVDGRDVQPDGDSNGFWMGPTLLDRVSTSSKVYIDEIFGPVLSVVRVKSYDEGVALINASRYGNGTAIFTNDGGAARRFRREVTVGMIGINVPIPVPVAFYSFGGWKESAFGDTKAYGLQGVHFFTREKTITERWLDPSHAGINLGFPQTK
jgi:malonate-semialdehyde dehydrogenase (acetylating)/methylmalonate-semialdehyde dehydrogenase